MERLTFGGGEVSRRALEPQRQRWLVKTRTSSCAIGNEDERTQGGLHRKDTARHARIGRERRIE